MGSVEAIKAVGEIVRTESRSDRLIVVVSALGGVTNQLVACTSLATQGSDKYLEVFDQIKERHWKVLEALVPESMQRPVIEKMNKLFDELGQLLKGLSLIGHLSERSVDQILSFGERLSSVLINQYFEACILEGTLIDSRQLIVTDDNYGSARVDFELTSRRIQECISKVSFPIVCPGFIASTLDGTTTTLGRGGSDYTAAILASVVNAEALEIWTDVDGVMTADPRLVPSSRTIAQLTFQEAMELSHFGAKVIYPPTIQPVLERKIPINIKNTFNPKAHGTIIDTLSANGSNGSLARGLTCIKDLALLNFTGSGMVGVPQFAARLFGALSEGKINVIIITQSSSEHSICVGIDSREAKSAAKVIQEAFKYELAAKQINPLEIETDLSIVALVGENMRQHVGVSGQMLSALGENGINIKAIAQGSSERNITAVIEEKNLVKALNVLHETFFFSRRKRINLFVTGIGNVGSTLVEQIIAQRGFLYDDENLDIRLIAIANSQKMYFDEEGIKEPLSKANLDKYGERMAIERFIEKMKAFNLRNSVFVDCTSSDDIAKRYDEVLKHNISVVTPNKMACTMSQDYYDTLRRTTREFGSKFLYETNVGAGLPILSTLNDLIKSGDKIHKIEGVLSGSLNFVFTNFDEQKTFAQVVRKAVEMGYSEPDPRIDLDGSDVKRKILILARQCGIRLEFEDIKGQSFIPESCMKASDTEAFLEALEDEDEHFQHLLSKATLENSRLKYIARYEDGIASAGLETVDSNHPFYNLEASDNIVLFYTARYAENPLVVKGAGAGAEVTASGVLADIIRIGNH